MFEGQGAICAVRFGAGAAHGAHRVVESAGLLEERAAGRPLYDSATSRARRIGNVLRGRDRNSANVNVMAWQGRMFALRDVAKPIEISPETLETLGETDLDGAILRTFTAHPHFVAAREATYGFGLRYGRQSALDLFELPARGPARRLGSLPIDPLAIHDFAASDRHLVFFLGPARLNIVGALLGEARADHLVRWDSGRAAEVIVVPIDDPERAVRFPVEPFYVWHFANAFERDGRIVVDFVRHRDYRLVRTFRDSSAADGGLINHDLGRRRAHARHGRLASGGAAHGAGPRDRRASFRGWTRAERARRAATCGPRPRRRARGRSSAAIWRRAAVATWVASRGQHVSEPIFAPRPGGDAETDGWILALVYDEQSETSHVAVLDASAPERGPLARVHFDHAVPLTLHGSFVAPH